MLLIWTTLLIVVFDFLIAFLSISDYFTNLIGNFECLLNHVVDLILFKSFHLQKAS